MEVKGLGFWVFGFEGFRVLEFRAYRALEAFELKKTAA